MFPTRSLPWPRTLADVFFTARLKISRTDPDRPYVIAVSIDDEGRYVVPECFPALPEEDFKRMVGDVNYTNNFASFVSRVRRGFVALAEAGL